MQDYRIKICKEELLEHTGQMLKEARHEASIALADYLGSVFKDLKVLIRAKEKPECPDVKFVERLEEVVRDARKEANERRNS